MRRVEKPIKCLPVWYPEDGIELLASWPIRMLERLSSTNERPADGSEILSWSSKTLTQVIDLISSRGWFLLDVCWVTEFLHAFQSPVTVCREPLSWPGTVSLPRGAPSCDESSSGTSQNKYLLSPSSWLTGAEDWYTNWDITWSNGGNNDSRVCNWFDKSNCSEHLFICLIWLMIQWVLADMLQFVNVQIVRCEHEELPLGVY